MTAFSLIASSSSSSVILLSIGTIISILGAAADQQQLLDDSAHGRSSSTRPKGLEYVRQEDGSWILSSLYDDEEQDDRSLLFLPCNRPCLFLCRCDGYKCQRGDAGDDDDDSLSATKSSLGENELFVHRFLKDDEKKNDIHSMSTSELETLEDQVMNEWLVVTSSKQPPDDDRDLFFFNLLGRCTKQGNNDDPTTPPPSPAPAPNTKTCTPGNRVCGDCQQTETFVSTLSDYCYSYQYCLGKDQVGDCALATEQCFQNNCATEFDQQGFDDNGDDDDSTLCLMAPVERGACPDRRLLSAANDAQFLMPTTTTQQDESAWAEDDDGENFDLPFPTQQSYVGFVRIPKTGSTSVLRFLQSTRNMYSWDLHTASPSKTTTTTLRQRRRRGRVAGCIFGHSATPRHLGGGYHENRNRLMAETPLFWNRCAHLPYPQLVQGWSASLSDWAPPLAAVVAAQNQTTTNTTQQSYRKTLHAFTMVREPFDRLVSYFYYLRKFSDTNQFLRHTVTERQYECVQANDLEDWMTLLHTEDGGRGLELPYQYKYLDPDSVDEAIRLLQHDGVYTLLTKCFAESLQLLTNSFCCFEPRAVDDFLESEDYYSNRNDQVKRSLDDESMDALRVKAEVWFADDYEFYNAAVKRFREHLVNAGMDTSCLG